MSTKNNKHASKKQSARMRLPGGEILTVTVHPAYLHLRRVAPGQRYFVHEVYVPRKKILPILRWLVKALRAVPAADKSHYPPLAMRKQLRLEEKVERERKAAARALDERRNAAAASERQRKRYLAAKRRARRKRTRNDD